MIKALIFDKDGTLFDFQVSWGRWMHDFLNDLANDGANQIAEMAQAAGFDTQTKTFLPDSKMIAGTTEEGAALLLPFFPDHTLESLTNYLVNSTLDLPMSEVLPLAPYLQSLKDLGLGLGIATNDAERAAHRQLDAVGAATFFDFIAGYDSGYGSKPEPGQLIACAKQIDISPAHIAMVGDSTHDLFAGRTAGMQTVGVLTGVAGRDELAPFSDVVFDTIAEIPDWLNRVSTA
jgi:phosphoglycolate phosphatase